jgi:hypothetical protein
MNKLETLKCVEVTSQTQANNGTVCYHDPITGCDYMSYESGYIRRSYNTRSYRTGKNIRTIYQLNPTTKKTYLSQYTGRSYETTERVMIHDSNYRLELLARAVANYRKTVKGYEENKSAWEEEVSKDWNPDTKHVMWMTWMEDSVNQYREGNLTANMALREIRENVRIIFGE